MTRVLTEILASKAAEVAQLKAEARRPPEARQPDGRVVAALARGRGQPLRLLAEIKRRSPSAGPLSTTLSVGERAVAYAECGVAMISVLCDGPFFDGSFEHLSVARAALEGAHLGHVPLLAKEFVIDAAQVDEAARQGASSVLIIARIVSPRDLVDLVAYARAVGLEPLVEVVTQDELAAALDADAKLIGVNARDLDTLQMDASRARRVLAAIPDDRVRLHLSGLRSPDDVRAVSADAALIGEALMREDDPRSLLRALVAAGG